jgi:hypothetical protein
MSFQKPVTSSGPAINVPLPILHAPETMMALQSGLDIDADLSDAVHNAYPVDGQDPQYSITYYWDGHSDPFPLGPRLVATHPPGAVVHLNGRDAAGRVVRQHVYSNAFPQKQHVPMQPQQQQYGPAPAMNPPGVYSQNVQHGSSYGQHLLPSPSDPLHDAALQRGGSEALPQQQQQHTSGPGFGASDFDPNFWNFNSDKYGHPLPYAPSPSDPFDAGSLQRDGSQAPPQQQQQISGHGIDAPDFDPNFFNWNSYAYGQNLPYVPSPSDSFNTGSLQRDGSQAPPQQQQQTDFDAFAAYGQDLVPSEDLDKGYPLLSSSDPSPLDLSTAAAYINNSTNHASGDQITFNIGPFTGTFNTRPTQHFGQQQQQRPHPLNQPRPYSPNQPNPPHPQNNAPNPNQPYANVYNNPPDNPNRVQHASYAKTTPIPPTATLATPVKREDTRGDIPHGSKSGRPIPFSLAPLIAALRAIPHVSASEKHPSRSNLKKPWKKPVTYDTATPAQRIIRDNFHSGTGCMKDDSELVDWFGDVSVFPRDFWNFVIQGKPREISTVKKKVEGAGKKRKVKSEHVGGGVKKQKRVEVVEEDDVSEGDVEEENATEGAVREDYVAVDGAGEERVVEDEGSEGEGEEEQEDKGDEGDVEEEEEQEEDDEKDSNAPPPPPVYILAGLYCTEAGKLLENNNGEIVGELFEGNAKELSESGRTADQSGCFWNDEAKVIGRARTVVFSPRTTAFRDRRSW